MTEELNEGTYARVVKDSISPEGVRLTSLQVRIHRFVLAEFNTHRLLSRSSASSRAIPVQKTLDKFHDEVAVPLSFPAEKSGMQGGEELTGWHKSQAESLLHDIEEYTRNKIQEYVHSHPEPETRLHKSVLNRPLEWFSYHTLLVTSTEWDNFFRQRCSPLAQPELRVAAEMMERELEKSVPQEIGDGQWHTPYIDPDEIQSIIDDGYDPRHISAARCARNSYETQEGIRDLAEDDKLFRRLVAPDGGGPPHAGPLEHVATPQSEFTLSVPGNFNGWAQLRHEVLGF